MKIIIKAGKEKSKIKLPRDKAEEMYNKILGMIGAQKVLEKNEIKKEEADPPAVYVPDFLRKSLNLPKQSLQKTRTIIPNTYADGYKGLLALKCPDCGQMFVVFERAATKTAHCRCGSEIPLENLTRIHCKCPKCGEYRYYWTNRTEPSFEMNCGACRAMCDVEYSWKHRVYKSPELFGSKKRKGETQHGKN